MQSRAVLMQCPVPFRPESASPAPIASRHPALPWRSWLCCWAPGIGELFVSQIPLCAFKTTAACLHASSLLCEGLKCELFVNRGVDFSGAVVNETR